MINVEYIDRYDSSAYGTTTFYFKGDKAVLQEYLGNLYPNAEEMEISIEFPNNGYEAAEASVMISPVEKSEVGESAYDWWDIYMTYKEINELVDLALDSERSGNV